MNMHWIDWTIVFVVLFFVTFIASRTKKYTRGVADFLSANRTAGRYLLNVAGNMAGIGAITVIGFFEIYYRAGFTAVWWAKMSTPIALFMALTGWLFYRYRETRAMTLSQFFEIRYSKRLRVFTGLVAFVSGILNFGIFPAVGARFFIYFIGIPDTINILGFDVSTFVIVMIILLSISVYFVFSGGQVTALVTDFIQGVFCSVLFLIIGVVLMVKFNWTTIVEALSTAPEGASMLHPLQTSKLKDFNKWYFIISLIGALYGGLSWQGSSASKSSSKSAHESKMSAMLAFWRAVIMSLVILLIPICVYTIMHHSDYSSMADTVNSIVRGRGIESTKLHEQAIISVALAKVLPIGLIGGFCAVMLTAFISTHDTYLHSWGSIFIQDVVLPFRKTPLSTKQHLWLLRVSVIGVAVFIFFFSLLFRQTTYIVMFLMITGTIFTAGAGSLVIGGLYWKRGTTAAAWSSMIVGSTMGVSGIIIRKIWEDFPINEKWMFFTAMICASMTYIVVSLLGKKQEFNMERMLHRGKYAIKGDSAAVRSLPTRGWRAFGMGKEFTRGDRAICIAFLIWIMGWWSIFVIGTIYNMTHEVKAESWAAFWNFYVKLHFVVAVITIVWYTLGGLRDLKYMFSKLNSMIRNDLDDGTVVNHHNLGEKIKETTAVQDKSDKTNYEHP